MRKKLYKTKAANKANLGKINSKCPLLLNFPACSSLALTYRISVFVTPTQYTQACRNGQEGQAVVCISETTDLVFLHNHLSNLQRGHRVSGSSLGHKSFSLVKKKYLLMTEFTGKWPHCFDRKTSETQITHHYNQSVQTSITCGSYAKL